MDRHINKFFVIQGQTFIEVMVSLFLLIFIVVVFQQFQINQFMHSRTINRTQIILSLANSAYDYEQSIKAQNPVLAHMSGHSFQLKNTHDAIIFSEKNRDDFAVAK